MSKLLTDFLQASQIGCNVNRLTENGELVNDKLYFSEQENSLIWKFGAKKLLIDQYSLILPGKVTGMLSVAPIADDFEDERCLGIVSPQQVLEIVC